MSIDELKHLDSKEKLILINEIWESIDKGNESVKSPSWHKQVLQERISKMKNGKAKYISLEELKN